MNNLGGGLSVGQPLAGGFNAVFPAENPAKEIDELAVRTQVIGNPHIALLSFK